MATNERCKLMDGFAVSELQATVGANQWWFGYSPLENLVYCSTPLVSALGTDRHVHPATSVLPGAYDVGVSEADEARLEAVIAVLRDQHKADGHFEFAALAADGPIALRIQWKRETALCQAVCGKFGTCAGYVIANVDLIGRILGPVKAWGVMQDAGTGSFQTVTDPVVIQQPREPDPYAARLRVVSRVRDAYTGPYQRCGHRGPRLNPQGSAALQSLIAALTIVAIVVITAFAVHSLSDEYNAQQEGTGWPVSLDRY